MHQPSRRHFRGLTLLEVMAAIVSIIVVLPILLPSMQGSHPAKLIKDSTQIQAMHRAMLIWATDSDGIFPVPGLVNRIGDTPGEGDEDITHNHTAALHSVLIINNFFSPELCISPTESSANVLVKDDYDYECYDLTTDIYWDPAFSADVEHGISHTSYTQMPIAGAQKQQLWNANLRNDVMHMGNRGPYRGAFEGRFYDESITLKIHGSDREWVGNICFADGHMQTMRASELLDESRRNVDGILDLPFTDDGTGVDDHWLGIYTSITEDEEMAFVWDPID
jgi:prepilin-type processing-associated H-X9-DG protein